MTTECTYWPAGKKRYNISSWSGAVRFYGDIRRKFIGQNGEMFPGNSVIFPDWRQARPVTETRRYWWVVVLVTV